MTTTPPHTSPAKPEPIELLAPRILSHATWADLVLEARDGRSDTEQPSDLPRDLPPAAAVGSPTIYGLATLSLTATLPPAVAAWVGSAPIKISIHPFAFRDRLVRVVYPDGWVGALVYTADSAGWLGRGYDGPQYGQDGFTAALAYSHSLTDESQRTVARGALTFRSALQEPATWWGTSGTRLAAADLAREMAMLASHGFETRAAAEDVGIRLFPGAISNVSACHYAQVGGFDLAKSEDRAFIRMASSLDWPRAHPWDSLYACHIEGWSHTALATLHPESLIDEAVDLFQDWWSHEEAWMNTARNVALEAAGYDPDIEYDDGDSPYSDLPAMPEIEYDPNQIERTPENLAAYAAIDGFDWSKRSGHAEWIALTHDPVLASALIDSGITLPEARAALTGDAGPMNLITLKMQFAQRRLQQPPS